LHLRANADQATGFETTTPSGLPRPSLGEGHREVQGGGLSGVGRGCLGDELPRNITVRGGRWVVAV